MLAGLNMTRGSAVERGATAVEYALLAALIAGVIVVTATTFGKAVLGLFTSVPNGLAR